MKVSVLCPDLSENCLGRSFLLAQLLERNYEVEIVGPTMGDGIWSPVAEEYEYKSVDMSKYAPEFLLKYRRLSSKISGDVVYASKPRMTSYGWGILHSTKTEKPLVLDIDDWESGFFYGERWPRSISHIRYLPHLLDLNSLNYSYLLERAVGIADQLTVSNEFLKNRFGGTIIPHVRDTGAFDPTHYDKETSRNKFDLPTEKKIVLFSGTPRPHKGLEDLIDAVNSLARTDISLLIVGADDSEYVRRLRAQAGENVLFRGRKPFQEIPEWIAAADIFAIPQRDTFSTRGQLPAKLFDAMAMGKAIIATDVSDIANILHDCGVVVDPNSPAELAEAIRKLAREPNLIREIGLNARQKCIEYYSYDAVAPKLSRVVEAAAKSNQS